MSAAAGCIDLLRHGEAAGGRRYRGSTDDPLTATGWEQMRSAVAGGAWDCIVSSPLSRCRAFAEALAAERGIDLAVDARLREMGFGCWEGRSAEELMRDERDALLRFWADPVANAPPDGEPLVEVARRVLEAWHEHAARTAGARVLMVSHGGPIRVILGHLAGVPDSALITLPVPLASLHRIELGDGRPQAVPRRTECA
ncbi:MAG: histidine phosphatase family protein [Pseudomonadota bacterium]